MSELKNSKLPSIVPSREKEAIHILILTRILGKIGAVKDIFYVKQPFFQIEHKTCRKEMIISQKYLINTKVDSQLHTSIR